MSLLASGESDREHTHLVAVVGLGLGESLDGRVPLFDEGAELVASDIKAMVVGEAVEALNLLALHFNLSPSLLASILVQVTERDLENAAAKRVGGDL